MFDKYLCGNQPTIQFSMYGVSVTLPFTGLYNDAVKKEITFSTPIGQVITTPQGSRTSSSTSRRTVKKPHNQIGPDRPK